MLGRCSAGISVILLALSTSSSTFENFSRPSSTTATCAHQALPAFLRVRKETLKAEKPTSCHQDTARGEVLGQLSQGCSLRTPRVIPMPWRVRTPQQIQESLLRRGSFRAVLPLSFGRRSHHHLPLSVHNKSPFGSEYQNIESLPDTDDGSSSPTRQKLRRGSSLSAQVVRPRKGRCAQSV